ncbi:MAG: galactokinase [Flavobacteriales bacterium]|nr:galactokinase [Flavobacteriales bacterium]
MKKKLVKQTSQYFEKAYQSQPDLVVLSPGRINLIGEHIDYNDGFVMPAAINRYVCFAIKKTEQNTAKIISIDLNQTHEFDLSQPIKKHQKTWINYFAGVLHQMQELIPQGVQIVFSSNLPIGAGLSSSAAVTCGFAFALNELFQLHIPTLKLAQIAQKTEHDFVGVKCGIMDQYANLFGKKNHFLWLDCVDFSHQKIAIDMSKHQLLLIDSQVKHSLLASGYNDRRAAAEKGKAWLMAQYPEIKSFRDVTKKHLEILHKNVSKEVYDCCLFVVEEIQRVNYSVKAIHHYKNEQLGDYLYQTHQGLSELYQVSCVELDYLVKEAKKSKDVLGARMMGGGFGGCMLTLIEKDAVKEFTESILKNYFETFGVHAKAYQIKIADGTHVYQTNN